MHDAHGEEKGLEHGSGCCSINFFFGVLSVFVSFLSSLMCKEDINAMEMEDDKRDLISREISKFRDTHKVMYQTALVTV